MTAGSRERILEAVRNGLVRAVLPDSSESAPRWSPSTRGETVEALVETFSTALSALSGRVHHAATMPDIAETVASIAAEHGATSYLSWDEEHLGCPGLLAALGARGLTRVSYDLPADPDDRLRAAQELAGIGLGLTGARAAIADSASMVLASGPGRGRLVSLLPPVHVAILRQRVIRPTLAALIADEPRLLEAGSNVVLISGPSRTADIEMTLSHGVHGPKHVHVILTP
jgi:L-lactate dehydrogenase complex protein LldG